MNGVHLKDLSLLLLLACIWSSSFVLIKVGVQTLPPLTLASGRMLLAALLLLAFAFRQGFAWPRELAVWRGFLVIGVVGNALPFTLIHRGELTVESGLTAILMGVMPIATAVLAHFFTRDEPLNRLRFAGVVMGLVGLLVLLGRDAVAGLGAHLSAEAAILCGALCYALTAVYVRRTAPPSGTLMAAGSLSVGALCLVPFALWLEQPWLLQPSAASLAAMLALGIFSTGLAALLFFHLIRQVGATYFSQVNYLIPVLGVGWGWALLAEQPTWQAWLALGCILTGVVLVNRARVPGR